MNANRSSVRNMLVGVVMIVAGIGISSNYVALGGYAAELTKGAFWPLVVALSAWFGGWAVMGGGFGSPFHGKAAGAAIGVLACLLWSIIYLCFFMEPWDQLVSP